MKNLKLNKLVLTLAIALVIPTAAEAHSTEAHTKMQIKQRYENSISYDYSKSEFKDMPSDKAPYIAGSLQDGVVNDVISRINFYRWLYGVKDITVRTDKLERNQKGAVIQSALNQLTHTPTKPADMDEAFYQEAYKGCYAGFAAGDTYSGNVSWGDRYLYQAIDGYVSDLNNVGSGVGHRLSVLDPTATQASFGKCGAYSTLSMFYEYGASAGTEDFYTYPSAGYFPTQQFTTNELWHIYATKSVSISSIQFKYDGQVYDATDIAQDDYDPVLTFKMPSELISKLGGSGKKMPSNTTIEVLVNGSKNYNYTVNFFDMNKILTGISLNKNNLTIGEGKSETLSVTLNPENADVSEKATWKSDNEEVATVDENGNVTAIKVGTANITVTLEGFTQTCKVVVTEKAEDITLTDITLSNPPEEALKGEEIKFTVTPNEGAEIVEGSLIWETSNPDIAVVDSDGTVHLLKEGEVTITAKVGENITDSKTFTVKAKTATSGETSNNNESLTDDKENTLTEKVEDYTSKEDKENKLSIMPNTGDIAISSFVALMIASGVGILVMIKKKKTTSSKH